jgi:hypothetical protein
MKKYLLLLLLPCLAVIANLPPTTSKGDGETTYKTTFETNYDTIPVTRTGTRVTIGTIPPSKGGTGSTSVPTNGQVPIGNGTSYVPSTITGTANQVSVTNGAGSITLSTPQDIATSSSPSFDGVTLTNTAHGSLNIGQTLNRIEGTYLVSGGVLSIDANPTRFDLSAGTGYVTDKSNPSSPTLKTVTWSAFDSVAVANLATADVTYILINDSGAIVQQTTYPTPQQRRDNIFIGRLPHINRTSISFALSLAEYGQGGINQLYDLFDSLGPFKINGLNISANGANLKINLSSGEMFSRSYNYPTTPENPNEVTITGSTSSTFRYGTQTTFIQTNVTDINPASYDNAGTVTTVPSNNNATIQRVYLFPTGAIRIYYGQNVYSNFAAAIDSFSNDSFIENPNSQNFATHIASIVITKSCTSLQDTTCSRIINTGKFGSGGSAGGGSTSLQQAYNNSVTPQITTSTSGGSLDLRRGSAADTDNVLRIQNGAGSATATITGAGVITGSNLSGTNTGDLLGGGDNDTPATVSTLVVPNKQLTLTGTNQYRVNTGSNNELENPNFEHSTVTTGWTVANATASADTSTPFEGKKSLSLALTGALSLSQSSTINAARKLGVQMVASLWVKSDDVSDLQLCSLKNGAEDKCTVTGGYVQGSGWRQLTVSFLGDSTSNGLKLKSTDTTGTVLVDQAFVGVGSPVVDFTPDMVYSASVSSGNTVSLENTDWITTCSWSSGTLTCNFVTSNFTVVPNCWAIPIGNSQGQRVIVFSATTSQVVFINRSNDGTANQNVDLNIFCQKQGADYKTSKAYVASGSVALNTTEYSAKISNLGVVDRENTDFINGNCTNANPRVCTFTSGRFTVAPNCVVTAVGGNGFIASFSAEASTTQVEIQTSLDNGAATQYTTYLFCQKQGADYTAAFNPVIVGSFQGYNSTPGSSSPKIYSAEISGTGAVSKEFGDLINGNCTSATPSVCTFTANRFSSEPNCSISVVGVTTNRSASFQAISSTSFSFNVNQNSGGVALMDFPVKVICHGE